MRRCSKCNRIYPSSETTRFCTSDGTSLLRPEEAASAPTLQDNISDFPTLKIKDDELYLNPEALEKAARINRALEVKELRSSLYGTDGEGVKYAQEAVRVLINQMEKQAKGINDMHPRVNIEFKLIGNNAATLLSGGRGVTISWQQEWTNSITDAELLLLERGNLRRLRGEPEEFGGTSFVFDVNSDFQMGWSEKGRNRFVTSEQLAGECLERLMNLLSTDSK